MIDRLIVPMSGFGKRFVSEGYKTPKYLLEFNKIPILSWQLDLLSDIKNIDLVCNSDHLENSQLKIYDELIKINKNVNIISIEPHDKGPGWALYHAIKNHSKSERILVSYCDFYSFFKIKEFETFLNTTKPDGTIFTYTNFHPHRLRNNHYAYVKKKNDAVTKVKEKEWFTGDPMSEEVSNGMYYYSDSLYLKDVILNLFEEKTELIGNELYLSVVYNQLINDKKLVNTFNVDNFFQFGTPQDYEDLLYWHNNFKPELIFKDINNQENTKSKKEFNIVLLASGFGSRLKQFGYDSEKATIPINNYPMSFYSYVSLLKIAKNINFYVVKRHEQDLTKLLDNIKKHFIKYDEIIIPSSTKGQADSLRMALKKIENDKPLLVLPCDSYFEFDLEKIYESFSHDALIWNADGYPYSRIDKSSFAWIKSNSDHQIIKSLFKESPPDEDWSMITGAFSFKSKSIAKEITNEIIDNDNKINNEYYLDFVADEKFTNTYDICENSTDKFLSLGTIDELKTFEYLIKISDLEIWKS